MRKPLALLVALAATLFMLPVAAGASPPEFREFDFEVEVVQEDRCGEGIDIASVLTVRDKWTTFFDGDGEAIRMQLQPDISISWTRIDTGETVEFRARYLRVDDLVTGERSESGAILRFTADPEAPASYGRQIFDEVGDVVFSAGQISESIFFGATEYACEVLS